MDLLRQNGLQVVEKSYSDLQKCGIVRDKNGAVAKRFPFLGETPFNSYPELLVPKGKELKWFGQVKIKKIDGKKKQTWAVVKAKTQINGKLQEVWAFYLLEEKGIEGVYNHVKRVNPE